MTWIEIKMLLKERPMPGIPAGLVAAIEARTVLRRRWWQSDAFRLRWAPALVGLTTALGAVWLSRIQQHPDSRAAISMAASPSPVKVTLHAFLSTNKTSDQEKGDRREHQKS